MTPLAKEQAEALAGRIEARARHYERFDDETDAVRLFLLAEQIRNGTFIEVQP